MWHGACWLLSRDCVGAEPSLLPRSMPDPVSHPQLLRAWALPLRPVGVWCTVLGTSRRVPAAQRVLGHVWAGSSTWGKSKTICTTRTNTSPSRRDSLARAHIKAWRKLLPRCKKRGEDSWPLSTKHDLSHKQQGQQSRSSPRRPSCFFPIQGNQQPHRKTNEGLCKLLLTFGDQLSICASTYAKCKQSKPCNKAPSLEGAIPGHPPVKRISIRTWLVMQKPPLLHQGHANTSVFHWAVPPLLYTKWLEKDVAW